MQLTTVVNFLQLFSESVTSYNTVLNVFSSLKTMSKIKGHVPTDELVFGVNMFMLGLKRTMGSSTSQKLPVTPLLLSEIHKCVDFSNSFHVCTWAAMLFMFYTMFRKSNVMPSSATKYDCTKQVARSSIQCEQDSLLVKVKWSKTIQFKDRVLYVPVSSVPGSILCPVQAYRRLLSMVKTPPDYPAFSYLKHGNVVPLTYSQFVRQFKLWLTLLEVGDKDLYSSHSFRRGGATFAFQCGVSPSLIKCQGDWSSDCYLKYISLTMADKLVTTRMMADRIGQLHL